jgi:ATP-dependent DNA helicase RecG
MINGLLPLPIHISDLLGGSPVEWERLEFKEGWNPLAVRHTLCAFANDFHNLGGGYVVVGMAERAGRPVLPPAGLNASEVDAIQKEVLNLGHSAIQPQYHPILVPAMVEGKRVLVLWAPGGRTRPYKARLGLGQDAKEWGYFIRPGACTVRAKGADELELLSLAATIPFDDRINQRSQLPDLSRELMQEFLKEVGIDLAKSAGKMPLEKLGRQMNIIGGPEESPFPLNVGLLFFNSQPYRFFPATQIDVVWFPEGEGGDRFEEKTFQGPLARMVREALDYIRRNYLSETVIKHPDRAEATRVENFPYAAVEEAVVNAIYHRSYEEREPVEVRISPEELVVLSFPGPDRSIRLADLRRGKAVSRRYRNRRIGEFLRELDLTEGRATGIPKILRAMRGNGSPAPKFETDDERTSFLIRLPVHPQAKPLEVGQVTEQVTEQVGRVVAALQSQTLAGTKIMEGLRLVHRPTFLYSYLQPALAAGLIEMTIPGKPNSRLQKYRVTDKGQAWLAKQQQGKKA